MKICLPSASQEGLEAMVFDHFGSAPFFTIYTTEDKRIEVIANENQHHDHGNCHPLAILDPFQIDAVITRGMGRRAISLINQQGIKAYLFTGKTVADAIQQIEKNTLSELTMEKSCCGHGCH
ncbi:MAG: NifB/NifX family molybdenum-iron cluster-binding protein [Spirochaetes bacterium]|nr:NifB/NifX family molybdenum-iron cluster-binding protein [Spirochaetota bacterium]